MKLQVFFIDGKGEVFSEHFLRFEKKNNRINNNFDEILCFA